MRGTETFSINTLYDSTITPVHLKSCWQRSSTLLMPMASRFPGVYNNRVCVTVFFAIWACLEIMLSSRAEDSDTRVEGRESPVHRVGGRGRSTQNISRGTLAGDTLLEE